MRVRVKRARALARVGRACAPGLSAVFNDSARQVMRTLAEARDLAALADAARARAGKERGETSLALEHVADALEIARLERPGLDFDTARAGLKDLLALAQVWPEASPRQIHKGARRIARRARRAFRRAHEDGAASRRHEWRKREKDRFFAALLLDDAWPRARRRKDSARLGEMLGEERDTMLLIARVEAAPAIAGDGKSSKRALKALRKRCARVSGHADELGKALHAGRA